jgi:NAD(P)-dependent dehydrogenase (short-subunit alcohol dehydrogenase family)
MAQSTTARVRWTAADVPDQSGRTALVTGANAGIGYETARILAERGARVLLACRDQGRTDEAMRRIRAAAPRARLEAIRLDLASLASVREAAQAVRAATDRIDLLINNAGVMRPPHGLTKDGFELQFGINHLGHFAFTAQVLPLLWHVPGSRVVAVSSIAHKNGSIHFEARNFDPEPYDSGTGYTQSKLANLLFAFELNRRLAAAGAETVALGAHPGAVLTALPRYMPFGMRTAVRTVVFTLGQRNVSIGALPSLRAATDPHARGGEYYGPNGRAEFRGDPVLLPPAPAALDEAVAERLWRASERLADVSFEI